jgi:hypothetical protein
MLENAEEPTKAFRELVRVLGEAVKAGADSVELEWEGRDLAVYRFFGNTGLGSVPIPKELQSAVLEELVRRAGLTRKPKGKMRLALLGQEYEVFVKEYDSFGESAFRLTWKKAKQIEGG